MAGLGEMRTHAWHSLIPLALTVPLNVTHLTGRRPQSLDPRDARAALSGRSRRPLAAAGWTAGRSHPAGDLSTLRQRTAQAGSRQPAVLRHAAGTVGLDGCGPLL